MNVTPVIILVRPQMGENIGAAARAMMNFGLTELRLVAPRDGWPNRKAYDMASGAAAVLDGIKVFSTLGEAVADVHRVYATSARYRDMPKPVIEPEDMMAACHASAQKSERGAFVFGPERTGLTNEEVALADCLVTIPTHPGHASLNVAQSVVLLSYLWFRRVPAEQLEAWREESGIHAQGDGRRATALLKTPEAATREETEGFFAQLEAALDASDFFKTAEMKGKMWQALRSFFLRAHPSAQEIRTLRGLLRSLTEPK